MGFDINQTILVGRLTRDPELTYTKSNIPICKFSIANNRGGKNNADEVNFFNITAWDKVGSTCAQYLKKGAQVIINGKLKQDRWKDDEGKNRSRIDVVANTVQFIGGKRDENQAPTQGQTGQPPAQPEPAQPAPAQNNNVDFSEFDSEPMGSDEIPF